MMRILLPARVAFFALAGVLFSQVRSTAQEPGSAAWKQLQQNPKTLPAEVKLKAPVQLVIMSNGQQVGSIGAPADSMVQLLAAEDSTLRIGVNSAEASVAPDQTDFADRLASAAAAASSTPTAPPTAPTPTNAPAAPPAAAAITASANTPSPPLVSGPPMQFDYAAAPGGKGYAIAEYHFWSPAYTGSLRGLIIMTPGSDGDGRGMTDDAAWQTLARKYSLALVGSHLQGGRYQRPELGTGDALRDALHHFADQSGHPEVTSVPLLLWGISAGGQFDYNYVLWKPIGVMAFVVNKGGYYNQEEADSTTRSIPGLFILGQSDEGYRIQAIMKVWTEGRSRGALWALAPQPNSGHEFSKTDALARVFFEAVLKARLPDTGDLSAMSADSPAPMRPMQENPGWLGNLTKHDIHDDSNDPDIDRNAAWLPDKSTAQAWKIFVSGG